MNGKNSPIQKIQNKELQEQTNQKKTFIQDIFNINYENTSKIYYQQASESSDVKVNNYLCYQQGQNLYKVTEIIYQDKLIRIQDKFQVSIDPEQLKINTVVSNIKKQKNGVKNIEKIRIFSKDVHKNGKVQKKDKKNIVKNIVKIFMSWLQKKHNQKSGECWNDSLVALKKMLEQQNFNNRLIKNIVNSKQTNKTFLSFLTDDAEDQIKYSRIQDKESHYEAIQLYISLLSQTQSGTRLNQFDNSNQLGQRNPREKNQNLSQSCNQNDGSFNSSVYQSNSEDMQVENYQSEKNSKQDKNNSDKNLVNRKKQPKINGFMLENGINGSSNYNEHKNSKNLKHSQNGHAHKTSIAAVKQKANLKDYPNVVIIHPQKMFNDESNHKKLNSIMQPTSTSNSNSNCSSNKVNL